MAKGNYNKCETMRKITSLFFLILILFSFTSCTRPHICICKKKAISNEYLYKASTGCNDSSIYYYSCECGKIGSETFMWTPAHTNGILKDICMDNEEGLKNCGLFYCEACKASYHKEIEYSDINIPIVSLKTDINNISKNEKSYTKFSYDGEKKFIKDATIKLQGASSTGYPKKNFSIQLFEPNTNLTKKFKVELKSGWGKESKYCLKANYIDWTASRNIISGRIYNQISKYNRKSDELNSLANGGVVDGYPILLSINGIFHGLYTLNIPKDEWMVGMSNTNKKQAMLFTNDWNDSVKLKKTINYQFYGWDLEYSSNDEVFWVMDSFNEMINFINYSTDKQFMDNISEYIDIDRAIDTMLYTIFIGGMDNISKNIMYVTYDGKKWIPNLYDLDSTWGLNWNGYIGISHNSNYEAYLDTTLWNRINKLYKDEIVSRYNELKTGPLAITNIEASFKEFNSSIPQMVFDYDAKKWPDMPHDYKNTLEYIKVWATDREYYLTEYFKKW